MKVLFAEYLTWNTPYRVGSHYYARHFLDLGWEVGWLGGEFHVWNMLSNRAELARKLPTWRAGGTKHVNGPWEYVPLKLIPYRDIGPLGNSALAWHGDRLTAPPIRRILANHGFDGADLLWISNPQAYPWLVDMPGYTRILYRAADNHAAREGIPTSVSGIEHRIALRADAVLVVPPDSVERFSRSAPGRTMFMPNGVDLRRFDGPCARPAEYADIAGPIAVYVGSIDYWFDADLLGDVAAGRPDVAFVLIGEPRSDISSLRSFPNIHMLGPRPPEVVPQYLLHANVGLLPFRDTPSTHNIRSLKLYEYAACGLPVVHSSMAPEEAEQLPILTASDANSFCVALDRALQSGQAEREAAFAFAAANSWEDRFRKVDAILEGWWPNR